MFEDLPRPVRRGVQRLIANRSGFSRMTNWRSGGFGEDLRYKLCELCFGNVEVAASMTRFLDTVLAERAANRSHDAGPEAWLFGSSLTANPILARVFQGLAFAEDEFCRRDLPQRSHEERLTGHLLSKTYSALLFCADAIERAAFELYGEPLHVTVQYHDLASQSREATTGSDFGVILDVNLPDFRRTIQSASFQAKVMDKNKAYLPTDQAAAQLAYSSPAGALVCIYDLGDDQPLPPGVLSTEGIVSECHSTQSSYYVPRSRAVDHGIPLSVFLILMAMGPDPRGASNDSLEDAIWKMASGLDRNIPEARPVAFAGPGRLLSISIGGDPAAAEAAFQGLISEGGTGFRGQRHPDDFEWE